MHVCYILHDNFYNCIFSVDINLVVDTDDNLKHHKEAPQNAVSREKSSAAVSW